MLRIIDEESEDLEQGPDLQCIWLLLDYFSHEISFRNIFDFVQAILKLFLAVYWLDLVQTILILC